MTALAVLTKKTHKKQKQKKKEKTVCQEVLTPHNLRDLPLCHAGQTARVLQQMIQPA